MRIDTHQYTLTGIETERFGSGGQFICINKKLIIGKIQGGYISPVSNIINYLFNKEINKI